MIVDGVTYDSVGVRFKGQTSYNTGELPKEVIQYHDQFLRIRSGPHGVSDPEFQQRVSG